MHRFITLAQFENRTQKYWAVLGSFICSGYDSNSITYHFNY